MDNVRGFLIVLCQRALMSLDDVLQFGKKNFVHVGHDVDDGHNQAFVLNQGFFNL